MTTGENTEAAALAQALTETAQNSAPPPESVPVHVVQSIRDELRQEKEKNEAFRNHIQMTQWNQQPTPPPSYNPFQGKDPKDSILVEDAAREFGLFANQLKGEIRSELAEVKMAAKTADYKDVINKYLPRAAQEDPELIQEIKNSANPYKTAYLAAKASQAYQDDYAASKAQKTAPPSVSRDAERMVANSKQSGNLSSVGNQANLSDRHQQYSNMSDEEFVKYKSSLRFKQAAGAMR